MSENGTIQLTPAEKLDKENAEASSTLRLLAELERDLPIVKGQKVLCWCDGHADIIKAVIAAGGLAAMVELTGIKRATYLQWLRETEKGQRAVAGTPVTMPARAGEVTDSAYWRGRCEGLQWALETVTGKRHGDW